MIQNNRLAPIVTDMRPALALPGCWQITQDLAGNGAGGGG